MNSSGRTSGKQLMKRSFAVLCVLVIGVNVLGAEPSLAAEGKSKSESLIHAIIIQDGVKFYTDRKTTNLAKIEKPKKGQIFQGTREKIIKGHSFRIERSGKKYYLKKSGLGILKRRELEICRKVTNNKSQIADMNFIINRFYNGACIEAFPKRFSRHILNETSVLLKNLKESACNNIFTPKPECNYFAKSKWHKIENDLKEWLRNKKKWTQLIEDITNSENRISKAKSSLKNWTPIYESMEKVRKKINYWDDEIRNVSSEPQPGGISTGHRSPTMSGAADQDLNPSVKETGEPADNPNAMSQQTPDQGKRRQDKSNRGIWDYIFLLLYFVSGFAIIGTVSFFAWRAWAEFRNLRERVKSLGKDVMRLQDYVSNLQNAGLEKNDRAASDRDLRGRGHGGVADRGQAYRRGTNIGRSSVREKVEPRTVNIDELMEDYARALMEPHAMEIMKSKWQGVGATRYSDGGGIEEAVFLELTAPRLFDEAEFWAFPYDNKGLYLICPGRSVRKQVASLVADDGRPAKKKFGGIFDIQGGTNFELKTSAVARENGNILEIVKMGILQLPAN